MIGIGAPAVMNGAAHKTVIAAGDYPPETIIALCIVLVFFIIFLFFANLK